ncbi:S9 family peptidase [Rhizocola hellebori]|nr:S9 family peptidase [Rhizocola hellebori]
MPSYRDFRPAFTLQPCLALSADGRNVAFADDSTGNFNLVIQPVAGGPARAVTTFTSHTVRRMAWHPDGGSLLFQADQDGNEDTQIFRVGLDNSPPEQLTDFPKARFQLALGDPLSADGTALAYSGGDRIPTAHDILVRQLENNKINRLFLGTGPVHAGYFSLDGARLSLIEWLNGYDNLVHVVAVDGTSSTRLTATEAAATYELGPWLPDGSAFFVCTDIGREFTGLALMSATTGELTWIDTPDWDVERVSLSADGNTLAWLVNVDGASQLRVRDLAAGKDLPAPLLPLGQAAALTVGPDGSFALMLMSTPTRPWNVLVADLRTGELRWLTGSVPNGSPSVVDAQLVRYPTHDGREIAAYVYRPSGVDTPLGVVLSIHGGPVMQERPAYVYEGFYQYLVSRGLAVIAPNIRGSSGYGASYQRLIFRDWGGGDLGDLAATVDFLRTQPWADPARIGLFGGSYGGFAVLSCVARLPELGWAAAVEICGPSNLITLAEATPPAYREVVAKIIGDPETDVELLRQRSPMTYVDRISTPLFVLQGANDPRVPQRESDQLVERLRARGVPVRYDIYPDEGHGFTKTDNQIKARVDAADFLLHHLS